MKTVLAIVESREIGQFLQRALGMKYNLTICSTVEAGTLLLQQKPDALILDLHTPDGLSLLEHHTTSLPPAVIAISSVCSRPVLQTVSQLGIDQLLRIPCTGAQITHHLDALPGKKDPSLSGG